MFCTYKQIEPQLMIFHKYPLGSWFELHLLIWEKVKSLPGVGKISMHKSDVSLNDILIGFNVYFLKIRPITRNLI